MVRRKILSWSVPALLTTALLLPAPAAGQQPSAVTVKRDGDAVVLIPNDPGKSYLVFGYTRNQSQKEAPGKVFALQGEQRLSAKDLAKLVVVELNPVTEVVLGFGKTGLQVVENPCKPGTCDLLVPLGCPPICGPR